MAMADYEMREVVIRHTEWIVKRGACAGEFDKAWCAACDEWRARNPDKDRPDTWAQLDADDEHIIIRLEVRDRG